MDRDDIYLFAQHSNLSEATLSRALEDSVYSSPSAWHQFLRYFFLAIGVLMCCSGIVFFFAYNWAAMHNFAKLSLVSGVLVIAAVISVLPNLTRPLRMYSLTAASVLVGALLALFGQIYQTGANAYDLFLSWTISIALWTAVSRFTPLWLLFVVLCNLTLWCFAQQMTNWSAVDVGTSLFFLNGGVWALSAFLKPIAAPQWFVNVIGFGTISMATISLIIGIFGRHDLIFWMLSGCSFLFFGIAYRYGIQQKRLFYPALIPLGAMVVIAAGLIHISDRGIMLFFIALFVSMSAVLTVKNLMALQKRWRHGD